MPAPLRSGAGSRRLWVWLAATAASIALGQGDPSGAERAWQRVTCAELDVSFRAPADWAVCPSEARDAATLHDPGELEPRVEVFRWPRTASEPPARAARHHEYLLGRAGVYRRVLAERCVSDLGPGLLVAGTIRVADGTVRGTVFATFSHGDHNLTIGAFCAADQIGATREAYFDRLVSSFGPPGRTDEPPPAAPASGAQPEKPIPPETAEPEPAPTDEDKPPAETAEPEPAPADEDKPPEEPAQTEKPSPPETAEPEPAPTDEDKPPAEPAPLPELLVTYLDPSGITFNHPVGWRPQGFGSGACVAPADGTLERMGVVWWLVPAKGRGPDELAEMMLADVGLVLPRVEARSQRRLGDTALVLATAHQAGAEDVRGVVVCSRAAEQAIALGAYCPREQAAHWLPMLAAILATADVDSEVVAAPASDSVDPRAYWRLAAEALRQGAADDHKPALLSEVLSLGSVLDGADDRLDTTTDAPGG